MRDIFADTGYWAALILPRDELHDVALRITDELPPHRIVTTEMILVELLNAMSKGGQQNRIPHGNGYIRRQRHRSCAADKPSIQRGGFPIR